MSKERDALKKAIGIINFTHPNTWHEFISEVEELLAQPVKYQFTTRLDQEPVMYQYRDKLDGKDWGRWNLCNKIDYEDYKNNPTFQHWTYQTRKLLAQPTLEPLSVEVIDELATKDAFYGGVFDFRIFARAIEKAHGIRGGE